MPYSLKSFPDKIKGLPAHAQKIWIEAFNNAYKLYKKDEAKANATAWSAVKKVYTQNKDGKWHKIKEARNGFKLSEVVQLGQRLKLKDILSELKEGRVDYGRLLQYQQLAKSLQEAGTRHSEKDNDFLCQIISVCQKLLKSRSEFLSPKQKTQEAKMKKQETDNKTKLLNLQEADISIQHATLTEAGASFDKEKGNLKLTVVSKGWSKNDNYWTQEALNDLPQVFADRRKVYVDHQMDSGKPRSIRDWAAQVVEMSTENEMVKSNVHLFDKPFDWLKERVEKFPEEVGVSVDVRAKVRQGEIDGRKGQIVERVTAARSFDFVAEASAGGKVDQMLESIWETQMKELPVQDILELTEGELVKLMKAKDESGKVYDLWYTLKSLLRNITGAIGQDETAKKKRISDALDEFKSMMLKFSPATFATEGIVPNNLAKEVKEDMDLKELNVLNLTQARPDLITEIKDFVIKEFKEQEEVDKNKEELQRLKEENGKMMKELDELKVKDAEQKKQEEIREELKKSKLDNRHITDQLVKDLMAAETKEERDAKIKDRIDLIASVTNPGQVKHNGERLKEQQEGDGKATMTDEMAEKEVAA